MVKIKRTNSQQGMSKKSLVKDCSFGCLKTTELSEYGNSKDITNTSLVRIPSDNQSRREKLPFVLKTKVKKVTSIPVIGKTGITLMPCHPARARELIKKGKALRRFKCGIFYIQLTERCDGVVQDVACGIDPGSKKEAFTVKSEKHTYINVLADAVTWVKEFLEIRKNARKSRRFRKTPCRKNKYNRKIGGISPSTKSRWQLKLRIINILRKLYPITIYIVEDICTKTKINCKKWNKSFSPLEVGKNWFYSEIRKIGTLELKRGYETKEMRGILGLKKSSNKLLDKFSAHNVDSWVLANNIVGGHTKPDNESIFRLIPMQFHRRQLHYFQPSIGNIRKNYGSTISLGLKRGSLINHKKHGICYVGGTSNGRVSLHNLSSGKRISQQAKTKDIVFLSYNYFKFYKVG